MRAPINETAMNKALFRMGRTDMTEDIESRQTKSHVLYINSKESIVQVGLPELRPAFMNTGMQSKQIEYQLKSLKFSNDQKQVKPGDYIEIRGRMAIHQCGTRHALTKRFPKDDVTESIISVRMHTFDEGGNGDY